MVADDSQADPPTGRASTDPETEAKPTPTVPGVSFPVDAATVSAEAQPVDRATVSDVPFPVGAAIVSDEPFTAAVRSFGVPSRSDSADRVLMSGLCPSEVAPPAIRSSSILTGASMNPFDSSTSPIEVAPSAETASVAWAN